MPLLLTTVSCTPSRAQNITTSTSRWQPDVLAELPPSSSSSTPSYTTVAVATSSSSASTSAAFQAAGATITNYIDDFYNDWSSNSNNNYSGSTALAPLDDLAPESSTLLPNNDDDLPDFGLFYRHPLTLTIVYCVAYIFVFIVGLVGNSFVIAVVLRSPRMRTVTNFFIVNLAMADILVIVFCLPATLMGNIFVRKYQKPHTTIPFAQCEAKIQCENTWYIHHSIIVQCVRNECVEMIIDANKLISAPGKETSGSVS